MRANPPCRSRMSKRSRCSARMCLVARMALVASPRRLFVAFFACETVFGSCLVVCALAFRRFGPPRPPRQLRIEKRNLSTQIFRSGCKVASFKRKSCTRTAGSKSFQQAREEHSCSSGSKVATLSCKTSGQRAPPQLQLEIRNLEVPQ